jgi:hypothetical protein
MAEKIAFVGLGYIGLPVVSAVADKFPDTVGFDIDDARIGYRYFDVVHSWVFVIRGRRLRTRSTGSRLFLEARAKS